MPARERVVARSRRGRQVLAATALATAAAVLATAPLAAATSTAPTPSPTATSTAPAGAVTSSADVTGGGTGGQVASAQSTKTKTPIKHFVFLMQENHTFDNYFGTRPGVDGIPAGTCMPLVRGGTGECQAPFHIGDRGSIDLDHTREAFETQYNKGKMDGFIEGVSSQGKDGRMAMAYYDDRDLPYYWNIADEYVLFDRFFSSSHGGSVTNHMYRVTGSPGITGTKESIPDAGWGDIPTIFDRLQAQGTSWKFYVENYDPQITWRTRTALDDGDRAAQVIWVPLLAYARFVDDPALNSHIVDLDQYYEDAATGNLPSVAFIAPSGDSEHPPGRVQSGQTLVRSLLTTLMRSDAWSSSAFLWSYDDWGGWYDHVVPPQVDDYGYGFRVPALMVSSYARRGYVDSTTLDFTSALKFIEVNWGVKPLAARDTKAETFLGAFDFDKPPRAPVLLGTQRGEPATTSLRTTPVYVVYGGVLGGTVLLAAIAGLSGRWRDRKRRAS
jgi:phospholipase C